MYLHHFIEILRILLLPMMVVLEAGINLFNISPPAKITTSLGKIAKKSFIVNVFISGFYILSPLILSFVISGITEKLSS